MEKQMPEVFQEAKYDVFISYSRKDYVDENNVPIPDSPVAELIDFLEDHGISCWIDKKGIYAGAEFAEVITTAICESKMLVFVSSKSSNDSIWTAGEIFEAYDRHKRIIPLKIDGASYSTKFSLLLRPLDYIDYFSHHTVSSLESLLTSIEKEKKNYQKKLDDENKRLSRMEDEKKRKLLLEQVTSKKEDYYRHLSDLKFESENIIRILREIGDVHKTCPICGAEVPLQDQYCETCGWTFVPPFETSPVVDEKHLEKALKIWKDAQLTAGAHKEISLLKEKISELEEKLKQPMISPNSNGHDYVDLGLPSGTLWATCNVGASKPSDWGDHFAWGETSPKKDYGWSNLKYRTSGDSCENVKFSKYVADSNYGTVDNRTRLELSDDAARSNWGGNWRMPAVDEWKELKNNCTWTWTSQGGHKGYKVTGKNGNSIFIPAAGWRIGGSQSNAGAFGEYWSSSLRTVESYRAFYCRFHSKTVGPSFWSGRYVGLSVRPVVSSIR